MIAQTTRGSVLVGTLKFFPEAVAALGRGDQDAIAVVIGERGLDAIRPRFF